MKPALLAAAMVCACGMATSADPPAPPVPSEERIRELVKKLETPTRKQGDQQPGPPDYAWDPFDYQWPSNRELGELSLAGDAAVPHLLALLNDKTKPGQARGFAAGFLVHRLVGPKTKPDPKIICAINDALKEKDAALRYGVLDKLARQGLAGMQRRWEGIKDLPQIKNAIPPVPRPEEHSFNAEVMDALLPAIVAALADERREIFWRATSAISEFGRPKFGVPELLELMKQPEIWKRTAAASALSRIATDDPDALRAVLAEVERVKVKPENWDYESTFVEAVGRFGPKAKPAVEKLAAFLKDNRPHKELSVCQKIHDTVVEALEKIGPEAKDAIPALLGCLKMKITDDDPGEFYRGNRESVLRALVKIDHKVAEKARADEKRRYDEYARWFREKYPLPVPLPLPELPPNRPAGTN